MIISPGDVISYLEMCQVENAHLQRGMNFRLHGGVSVVLMSTRHGAPYSDRVEDEGHVLIYEGHNASLSVTKDPENVDQPTQLPSGKLTQNGLFYEAVRQFKSGKSEPEFVKAYEKIKDGIWVYNGLFKLVEAWQETQEKRRVWKFRLELLEDSSLRSQDATEVIEHARLIPSSIKLEVWKRDGGKCVKCGITQNLHFDHIIPYSRGGTSITSANIQLLCVTCNLSKSDKIE